MHRYRITVRTDNPKTQKGKGQKAVIDTTIASNETFLNNYLEKIGLPVISAKEMSETILEDHILETENEINSDMIEFFVNNLSGNNTLSSWDEI